MRIKLSLFLIFAILHIFMVLKLGMHQYSRTGCKDYWVPNELIRVLGTVRTWYPVGQGTHSQNWYPIRNWYLAKRGVEPTNEFIGYSVVFAPSPTGTQAPSYDWNWVHP